MFDEEEGPKDWELKEEEPPETLKRKWEREERSGSVSVVCPSCKKDTPAGNLTCLFCSETLLREYGAGHRFVAWIKRWFK